VTTTTADPTRDRIADAIRRRRRFVLTSHVRPDDDAIGSQLAMAYALRAMGKDVRMVNHDPPPPALLGLPGVRDIEVAPSVDDPGDAVIVMECGDLPRTGVEGLDRGFVINIDHHPGNTEFGALNWLDQSAAACGEMVFDLVRALDVPLGPQIATHVYVAILTDTGSFRHSNITTRTFEICRQCAAAGVDAAAVARQVYDSNGLPRLKLFGAVLNGMQLDRTGRIATIAVDRRLLHECGASQDDTQDLVNEPLTVRDIQAVAFFKELADDEWRLSMRSKGTVNVRAVAAQYGGGGHRNAAGCTMKGRFADLSATIRDKISDAVDEASR
jgi:bifunctional oligoribonuclease and PAP phosphatase NrnA